jgi:hypothetical protein
VELVFGIAASPTPRLRRLQFALAQGQRAPNPAKILGWSLAATSTHVELASVDVANRENYLIDLWAKAIDGNGQPAQPRSSQPKRR